MTADPPTPQLLRDLGPRAAAALWLERLQRGPETIDDAAFAQWLQASEDNRRAWDSARALWDVFEDPQADDVLASHRRQALALRGQRPTAPTAWYLAAASIAAVVIGGVLFSSQGREHTGSQPTQVADMTQPNLRGFGQVDYQTGADQRLDVRLEDGTRLALGPSTSIDVAYVDGQRLVRLTRGQALFDVKHDAAHPFRVAAGGRVVSDLGTRFNIEVKPGETRVRLDEGSLGVTVGDDPHVAIGTAKILVPGQELVARQGQADEVTGAQAAMTPDEDHRVVQFDNISLAQAVEQMNRFTDRKLVVTDRKVAAMRVSGAFRTNDAARFAETLTTLYPVRLVPLADGSIEIAPRGKSRR